MSPISLNTPKQSSCRRVSGTSALCTSADTTWCGTSGEMAGSEANVRGPRPDDARAEKRVAVDARVPQHGGCRHLATETSRGPAALLWRAAAMDLDALERLARLEQHLRARRAHQHSRAVLDDLAVFGEVPGAA